MKKFVSILLGGLMAIGMMSCTQNEEPTQPNDPVTPSDTAVVEEPKVDVDPEGLIGEWELYRYTARIEVTVLDTMKLLDEFIDTTFVDTTYKFRMTADSLLLVDGDTIGSWVYDEMESTLTIKSDSFNSILGGSESTDDSGTISTPFGDFDLSNLPIPDFSEITMDINSYSEHKAKTSFKKSDSGTLAIFPYDYSVRVSLYLRR